MSSETAADLLDLVEQAVDRLRREEPDATRGVEERYAEVLETLDWLLTTGRIDDAFRLADALTPFWRTTKRIDDGDCWFKAALAEPGGSDLARSKALYNHGYLVFWAGRYELAAQRFGESRQLARAVGNRSVEAHSLAGLARVALNADVDEALRLLREGEKITSGMPDWEPSRSNVLHVLGVALQMSGDLVSARDVMLARLDTGLERGDKFVVWVESANLSTVERKLGNLERAAELSRQVLVIDAKRGDEMSIAWTLNGLAAVVAAQANLERAAILNGLAEGLLKRAGGDWPPDEREDFDQTLDAISAGLDPDVVAELRARGEAMSAAEGVAFALS